jgi:predicted SprT family Zn-dependent metalloprotease
VSALTNEHLVLVSSIYGHLRSDNPHLNSLPINPLWIRWRYLPVDRWRCFGEAQDSEQGITISINPLAFGDEWLLVLQGIINHELVHCLMPHEGHNQAFHIAEAGWEQVAEFKSQLAVFRDYVKETIQGRNRFDYECSSCSIRISVDRFLPSGSACRVCCSTKNRGQHTKSFELTYLGQGTRMASVN